MTSVISMLMAVKTCSKAISAYNLGHGKSPCFSEVTFLSLVGPDYPLLFLSCADGAEKWSVHFDMETTKNLSEHQKETKSKRKDRRFKYNQQLLKRTDRG